MGGGTVHDVALTLVQHLVVLPARLLVAKVHHGVHHIAVLEDLSLQLLLPLLLLREGRLERLDLHETPRAAALCFGDLLAAAFDLGSDRLQLAVARSQLRLRGTQGLCQLGDLLLQSGVL